jgi:hypothetical protein
MHVNLLLGFEDIGISIRDQLVSTDFTSNPWQIEIMTLIGISFYSSSQSKQSVAWHRLAVEKSKDFPEIYFKTFGASIAQRAALKANDAEAFEFFSMTFRFTI